MKPHIRRLEANDYPHMEALDTGIKDDYVKHIFPTLTTGNNRLFGLFLDKKMVSLGGYTVFANRYAMLGRLLSERHFKNQGFSTTLMNHVLHDAFQQKNIQWAGGNTQENNISGQRVLEKIGLSRQITLTAAITQDLSPLYSGAAPWHLVTNIKRKKSWVNERFMKQGAFFPLECYYPLPGSAGLFPEEKLAQWHFYENNSQTRILILKTDQKKHTYLQAIYPWDDITTQPGLWESMAHGFQKLQQLTTDEAYIWMDLTKQAVESLPARHPFELPSPWIVFGIDRSEWSSKYNR